MVEVEEKWASFDCILKVELTGFAEEYEIGQGLLQFLWPLQAKGKLTFAEMQKVMSRAS